MENELCFDIKGLKCSYRKGSTRKKVVLDVDMLQIPKGKVVFFVGRSGCGKSTLLETLGLMNDTISEVKTFTITPEANRVINGAEIWSQNNRTLSEIRTRYFSFIFQETNLMSNFTIRENVEIAKLVKGGTRNYKDVISMVFPKEEEAKEILSKEGIGDLSGGQRQRLAFARAFMPDYHILFCDEPTGNLDPDNADILMKIVSDEIKKTGKTAIIVSHSPELSVKYADCIVNIKNVTDENTGDSYGKIDASSIYERNNGGWSNHSGQAVLTNDELKNLIWPNDGKVL